MQNHKLAAETNLFCASCARFQVMNRNGYVPCQCHVRFWQTCPLLHFCWPLTSVTLIYLTFSMLASVILAPSSFLVFSFNLSTFSRALGLFWLRWPHRMAVIMCEVIKRHYELRHRAEQYFYSERKLLSSDCKESEQAESFERNKCVYGWVYVDKTEETKQ